MKFVSSALRRGLGIALALLLCASLLPTAALAAKAEASATTMRIVETEGTVTVKNGSGQKVSLLANMQLYNGWTVETAAASYATLSLDNARALKLGANTKIELRQNTLLKNMELYVSKGNVFFDIANKLAADENLSIHTSTAICGIRGTIGEVKVLGPLWTQMYLLEGASDVVNTLEYFFPAADGDADAGESAAEGAATAYAGGAAGAATAKATVIDVKGNAGSGPALGGTTSPLVTPTTILTVRSGDGRTTVFVENTLREVVVNGVTVPSGSKANVPAAGAAPKVSPMTPADRQELGASLAARSGAQPASGDSGGGAPAPTPAGAPMAPAGLITDNYLASNGTSPLAQALLQAESILGTAGAKDLSSIAMRYFLEEAEWTQELLQSMLGDNPALGTILRYISNMTPEIAAQVKAQEEQGAASNLEACDEVYKEYYHSLESKAKEAGAGSNVVNTWDGNPGTDPLGRAITAGTAVNLYLYVTVNAPTHGTLKVKDRGADKEKATPGHVYTLTVTPDEGYEVDVVFYSYMVNGAMQSVILSPAEGVYSFTMPAYNVWVSAVFKEQTSRFTQLLMVYPNIQNGTVTTDKTAGVAPGNSVEVPVGETITVTATPDEGYAIDRVYYVYYIGNGVDYIGNNNRTVEITPVDGVYRFDMPSTPAVRVYADFKEKENVTLTLDDSFNGIDGLTVTAGGETVDAAVSDKGVFYTVPYGAQVTVTYYSTDADTLAGLTVTAGQTATRAEREFVEDGDGFRLVCTYDTAALNDDVTLSCTPLYALAVRSDSDFAATSIGDYGGQTVSYPYTDNEEHTYTVYAAEAGDAVTLTLTVPVDAGYFGTYVTAADAAFTVPLTGKSLTVENGMGTYQASFTMPECAVTAEEAGLHELRLHNGLTSDALSFDPGNGAVLYAAAGETVTLTVGATNDVLLVRWGNANLEVTSAGQDDQNRRIYKFNMPVDEEVPDYPIVEAILVG